MRTVPQIFRLMQVGRRIAIPLLVAQSFSASADPAPFELGGPALQIEVTRKGQALPISRVPSLEAGDRISVRGAFSQNDGARFVLASAFLRGATSPPPKEWIAFAETWKPKAKNSTLTLTVPDDARQMILMLVPETGGAEGVLRDAVRGKPGEFVRASQDLNQASLDHSRLETFMGAIRAQDSSGPESLKAVAPVLAGSLSIKLQEDCLDKVIQSQASCLVQNREQLVLADVHTSSLAETITGTPTELALQLSNTREAGGGYYSPYIAVARDVAKIFGAFSNPQFDYLPTLTRRNGDRMSLLLNAAPSFQKPKSVMIVAMPAIEADLPPRLRSGAKGAICMAPQTVLPVEGAPLVFATDFAHDMKVRLTASSGYTMDIPVIARAERGGYVLQTDTLPAAFVGEMRAHLSGMWGFAPFDGPDFTLQRPANAEWHIDGDAEVLIAGRDNGLTLVGSAAACVDEVTLRSAAGQSTKLSWSSPDGRRLQVRVPLGSAKPGNLRVEVRERGGAVQTVSLRSHAEVSRIEALDIHEGDRQGLLIGQRLDQVRDVQLGQVRFLPGELSRKDGKDRLTISAQDGGRVPKTASADKAVVTLKDGRTLTLPLRIGAARARPTMLSRTIYPGEPTAGARTLQFAGGDLLPQTGEIVFSLKAGDSGKFGSDTAVEISADGQSIVARLQAGKGLTIQSPDVVIATLRGRDLPVSTYGALQFRVVGSGDEGGGMAGDWMPLATLVRLPTIEQVDCAADGKQCTIRGRDLFLIDALSADDTFAEAVSVPLGFTGRSLDVQGQPSDGMLRLRLRDAADRAVKVSTDKRP